MEIVDLEKTEDDYRVDRIREESWERTEWKGKIKTEKGVFNFVFRHFRTSDNGSDGVISEQPVGVTDDDWCEMTEFIENNYRKERQLWEVE